MQTQNKILIVDDDPVNLEFFQLMLSKLGFTVEQANDGLEALGVMKKFVPSLILLDNIMPKMSGWELTKTLKADSKFKDIPIIMFSALDDVKDKLAGFELGIDDYITKPFNFSEVLARIKRVLKSRELTTQVSVFGSQLSAAEDLNRAMWKSLSDFTKCVEDIDTALTEVKAGKLSGKALAEQFSQLHAKVKSIRTKAAELDSHIEKKAREWSELKKGGAQIQEFLSQE